MCHFVTTYLPFFNSLCDVTSFAKWRRRATKCHRQGFIITEVRNWTVSLKFSAFTNSLGSSWIDWHTNVYTHVTGHFINYILQYRVCPILFPSELSELFVVQIQQDAGNIPLRFWDDIDTVVSHSCCQLLISDANLLFHHIPKVHY